MIKAIREMPWILQHVGTSQEYPNWSSYAIRSKTNVHLATVGGVDRYYEGQEKEIATLMQTAPELLEKLEIAVEWLRDLGYGTTVQVQEMKEIIAKAKSKGKAKT